MTEPPALPNLPEVTATLSTLQSSLGAFVQASQRQDDQARSAASARASGAYRKLVAAYEALPAEAQPSVFAPVQALHETLVGLGIPLAPFKLAPPPDLALE